MIQDIQPKHLYNQYKPVPPDRESWAFDVFVGNKEEDEERK